MNYIVNFGEKQYYNNNYVPSNGANLITPENIKANGENLKENVVSNVSDNPVVKSASNSSQDPKVLLGALCFWPVLNGVVKPINKSISGEYSSSLFGKIGEFGDKIFNKLGLEKMFGKKATAEASTFIKDNRFTKYFTKDFATVPKISLVKSLGTKSELANDAVSVLKDILEKNPSLDLTKFFKESTLKDLGITADKAAAGKVATDYLDDLIVGLHKMVNHCNAEGISEEVVLGKLKRHVRISELRNKLITISPKETITALKNAGIENAEQMAAKTPLGKGLSKGVLRTLEGLTNGMAGGPGGIIIQAYCFAQATKEAIEAPKGEKLSTFMHVVTNDLGSYLLFATSKDIVYQLGGNKYRGMTKEGLNAFRNFLTKTNAAGLTGDALKVAKAQKKLFLKGVPEEVVKKFGETVTKDPKKLHKAMKEAMSKAPKLKFWERPLKKIGTLFSAGLDSIKSGKGSIVDKIPTKLKGFLGGGLRFVLVMLVVAPILLKPFMAICHKIFGTPTAYLKKEGQLKDKDKKAEDKKTSTSALDQIKQNQNTQNVQSTSTPQNVMNQQQNTFPQQPQQMQQPQQIQQAQKPGINYLNKLQSQKPTAAAASLSNTTPIRQYIPSSEATKFEADKTQEEEIQKLLKECNNTISHASILLNEKTNF